MMPIALGREDMHLPKRVSKLLAKRRRTAATLKPVSINSAWASFRQTKAGKFVAAKLAELFHGKCGYCEQVVAKDIEHYRPKSLYPVHMYDWDNWLWSCKNCNTEKLAHFPLDADGTPVLLNPTRDEPFDYFRWDELSGRLVPHPEPRRRERAIVTRDLLALDQLAEQRPEKLLTVVYLLARVINEHPIADDTQELLRLQLDPRRPWLSVVRQLFLLPSPDYGSLVVQARAKLPILNDWLQPLLANDRPLD